MAQQHDSRGGGFGSDKDTRPFTQQSQIVQPPVAAPVAAAGPAAPANLTEAQAMERIMASLREQATADMVNALYQGGYNQKIGDKAIRKRYDPWFESAFNQIFTPAALANLITPSMAEGGITPAELQQATTQGYAQIPGTFGESALTSAGTLQNNLFTQGLNKLDLRGMINNAFTPEMSQSLIDQIVNEQLGLAQAQIENQNKRGLFTPTGYQAAQAGLTNQTDAATAAVTKAVQDAVDASKQGLNANVDQYYSTAAGIPLGGTYDVAGAGTDLAGRINTATSGLAGTVQGNVGQLYDPALITHNAGIQQGMTGSGSILDTLSQRKQGQPNAQNRGLGTQGAF